MNHSDQISKPHSHWFSYWLLWSSWYGQMC